jgi:hypothetical protein
MWTRSRSAAWIGRQTQGRFFSKIEAPVVDWMAARLNVPGVDETWYDWIWITLINENEEKDDDHTVQGKMGGEDERPGAVRAADALPGGGPLLQHGVWVLG